MILRVSGKLDIAAGLGKRGLRFLIKDVAEAFIEQQWENELLVVACVDGPTQEHSGTP
jgi:hypothetical protein